MCACTEPVETGISGVCVDRGRPNWPITMLNHTYTLTEKKKTSHPTRSHDPLRRAFFFVFLFEKTKKKQARALRFALRTPHYNSTPPNNLTPRTPEEQLDEQCHGLRGLFTKKTVKKSQFMFQRYSYNGWCIPELRRPDNHKYTDWAPTPYITPR